jgi:hypothetical protein
MELPADVKEKVMYTNACKILGLPVTSEVSSLRGKTDAQIYDILDKLFKELGKAPR